MSSPPRLLCFATQGAGGDDEARIRALLEPLEPTLWRFDRGRRVRSAIGLLRAARRLRPDLVVMEGTGIAGGLALLALRARGTPYVVSSGDAVGPFLRAHHPALGPPAALYERLLYAYSAGAIGWSPYLAGRALTLGAPRAMTAANWAPPGAGAESGADVRSRLGIPPDAIVFGLAGSLNWDRRRRYCYGLELVRASQRARRSDVAVLVVGDGSGLDRLLRLAGRELGRRVFLPGRVPRGDVRAHLEAMDVASLPQSVDGVGSFRYTTKLSEYVAAGLPAVTGQIPAAYDLDDGWLWRLPGEAPWSNRYVDALASLMATIDREAVAARKAAVPRDSALFDAERQRRVTCDFVADIVARRVRPSN